MQSFGYLHTNSAQYRLLYIMAGGNFRNIFVVGNNDQTIHEWNDARVERLSEFRKRFSREVMQLPANFRCDAEIVAAANRLIANNSNRMPNKASTRAGWTNPERQDHRAILNLRFETEQDETRGIAQEIKDLPADARNATAVLARNRYLLEALHEALRNLNIPAALVQRRDDFVSPEMSWLVTFLAQLGRPMDHRNMARLVHKFNAFSGVKTEWEPLVLRSKTNGITLLSSWFEILRESPPPDSIPLESARQLYDGNVELEPAIRAITDHFEQHMESREELKDDLGAWSKIRPQLKEKGSFSSVDLFLQQLDLNPKDPIHPEGAVMLMTIHGAKGSEFDTVYLIGMAEGILPSYYSLKPNAGDRALEEERRACFVAMTRARDRLILSRASRYRGRDRKPSRFLAEMKLDDCSMQFNAQE